MISNTIPTPEGSVVVNTTVNVNWFQLALIAGACLVAILIIALCIYIPMHHKKKFKKEHSEWLGTQKHMTEHKTGGYASDPDYISMTFKHFHDYYSINPERYELRYAKVLVINPEYVEDQPNRTEIQMKKYRYAIIFNFKEYKKYRDWVEKSTNGMKNAEAIGSMLDYLALVQSDIQVIRDREAVAVNESQKTMQEVMGRIKEEVQLNLEKDTGDPFAHMMEPEPQEDPKHYTFQPRELKKAWPKK